MQDIWPFVDTGIFYYIGICCIRQSSSLTAPHPATLSNQGPLLYGDLFPSAPVLCANIGVVPRLLRSACNVRTRELLDATTICSRFGSPPSFKYSSTMFRLPTLIDDTVHRRPNSQDVSWSWSAGGLLHTLAMAGPPLLRQTEHFIPSNPTRHHRRPNRPPLAVHHPPSRHPLVHVR